MGNTSLIDGESRQMTQLLDALDLKLLAELQEDCSRTCEQLADKIGASRSSVQRRLKRLREEGVIEAESARISQRALGRPMSFVIAITLERETAEATANFMKKMRDSDAVQQCYYTTGEADFIAVLTAQDMSDYNQIVDELFVNDARVRRFHTNVVIKPVKVGLSLPIPKLKRKADEARRPRR
jgi:Lrp/AsnC family leucine-responsive transcriptional regulator